MHFVRPRANIQKTQPKIRLKGKDSQNCTLLSLAGQLHSKTLKMPHMSAQ